MAAAVAAMAGLHLVHFGLPPLQPDETSLPFMALPLLGEPTGSYESYAKGQAGGLYLGPFPIFYGPYIGVLGGYASLPFQWAFGPGTDAIRAYSLFSTILIQLSLYFATREFFSARAGGAAAALFTCFPLVIFYSRQSMTYDWIVLALGLCVLYLGMRFFKGGSLWNLCTAVALIGVMLWAYLFTAWFVLGVLAALPLCAAALRSQAISKMRLAAALSASAAVGAIPLILQHAMSPYNSPAALIWRTVSGSSASLASDNWDFVSNLHLRSVHFYDILTRPHHGFQFASLEFGWLPFEPAFFILLAASVVFAAAWVARRMKGWRRVAGLLVVLAVMFLASTFTVSHISIMQLGIMLPCVFMLIGASLDGIVARTCAAVRALRGRGGLVVACAVAVVAASQAPVVADGFVQIADEPHSQYRHAVDGLDAYLSENGLIPVEMDFWTRSMFFMMDGKHVTIKASIGADIGTGFDPESRDAMPTAEDFDLVRTDVAFVIYAYPKVLDCGADMDASMIPLSNQCGQAHFVESAAERHGLDVETRDFGLPDGTPYYRVLRMVEAGP